MNIKKQISKTLVFAAVIICLIVSTATSQTKRGKRPRPKAGLPVRAAVSTQYSLFLKEAADAGIDFKVPVGFKELPAINNENFTFDYAMTLPGQDFEVWFQVHSLKQDWASYEQVKNITGKTLANPDSTYNDAARAQAAALSDDSRYFTRTLSRKALDLYNADAGKTFLFDVAELPETRNYKYALVIAVQKNHVGYVIAVCLTNDKGPAFFKNINLARDCAKFR
jgi:hypothetical protein